MFLTRSHIALCSNLRGAKTTVIEAGSEDAVGELWMHLDARENHCWPPDVKCFASVVGDPVYLPATCPGSPQLSA